MHFKLLILCLLAIVLVDGASLAKTAENIEKKSDVSTYVLEPSSDNGQIDDALTSTDIPPTDSGEDLQNLSLPTDTVSNVPHFL